MRKLFLFIFILFVFFFLSCSKRTIYSEKSLDDLVSESLHVSRYGNGISPDELLLEAMKNGDSPSVRKALSEGADANVFYEGKPLLYHLVSKNQTEIALLAIERGANGNWVDDEEKLFFTPLEKAWEVRYNLTHYHGSDTKFDEDSDEVKNIDSIIEYLAVF